MKRYEEVVILAQFPESCEVEPAAMVRAVATVMAPRFGSGPIWVNRDGNLLTRRQLKGINVSTYAATGGPIPAPKGKWFVSLDAVTVNYRPEYNLAWIRSRMAMSIDDIASISMSTIETGATSCVFHQSQSFDLSLGYRPNADTALGYSPVVGLCGALWERVDRSALPGFVEVCEGAGGVVLRVDEAWSHQDLEQLRLALQPVMPPLSGRPNASLPTYLVDFAATSDLEHRLARVEAALEEGGLAEDMLHELETARLNIIEKLSS